jgi:hypothetical protein
MTEQIRGGALRTTEYKGLVEDQQMQRLSPSSRRARDQ